MLKVLIENSMVNSVLFIDDFEKILSIIKTKDEDSEDFFDPSWLYGNSSSPETLSAEKTLDKILQLHKIKGLRIIITLKSQEFYEEIKRKIKEKNNRLSFLLMEPVYLSNFLEQDIFLFYKSQLEDFFRDINYTEYFESFKNSYFPLKEYNLKFIFKQSKGNPREILKLLIKTFSKIILSKEGFGKLIE